MQGRKFHLNTNVWEPFQENIEYQDSGGVLAFDGMVKLRVCLPHPPPP
jgi:hypothetical protein